MDRTNSGRARGGRKKAATGDGGMSDPGSWLRHRVQSSEAGDTLIEILVAMVIIALTVTALLGRSLVTAITKPTTEQSLSTVDSVLNSFAQSAVYEVQQANVFTNCTTTPYRFISSPSPSSGPAGSSATVFVTGFAASQHLAVNLTPTGGGGAVPATITSGSTTDGNGDAAVTFTVPNGCDRVTNRIGERRHRHALAHSLLRGRNRQRDHAGGLLDLCRQPDPTMGRGSTSWVDTTSANCPNSGSQQITAVARARMVPSGR